MFRIKNGNMSLGEAELTIMKVLWRAGEPVNTPFINKAVEDKQWKRTTISTFLTRLVDKGVVSVEKRGSLYYYTACLSAKEYRKAQTKQLIANLYNGSVKDLAAALFEEEKLSREDVAELRAFLQDKEG